MWTTLESYDTDTRIGILRVSIGKVYIFEVNLRKIVNFCPSPDFHVLFEEYISSEFLYKTFSVIIPQNGKILGETTATLIKIEERK